MLIVRHNEQAVTEWREGVNTSLRAAASTGASALCVIEQRCDPGKGAPRHVHPNAEEVIIVLDGSAEFVVESETATLNAGDAVTLPEGAFHAFRNVGHGMLHIVAVFSSATPIGTYEGSETLEIGGFGRVRKDAHRAYVPEAPDPPS